MNKEKSDGNKIFFFSDVGCVRTNNEDNGFVLQISIEAEPAYLICVADGMGGLDAGELASQILVETIHDDFVAFDQTNQKTTSVHSQSRKKWAVVEPLLKTIVYESVKKAVHKIREQASQKKMGTTLALAIIYQDMLLAAWIGDSRIYKFGKGTLMPISKDHSLVQSLVDSGKISQDEAINHPKRNVITRCISNDLDYERPDIRVTPIEHDDIILVCSDGLTGELTDVDIRDVLTAYQENVRQMDSELSSATNATVLSPSNKLPSNIPQITKYLVEFAKRRGGQDNISVGLYQHTSTARPDAHHPRALSRAGLLFAAVAALLLGLWIFFSQHPARQAEGSQEQSAAKKEKTELNKDRKTTSKKKGSGKKIKKSTKKQQK